jgi:hypothetical protein
MRGFVNKKKRLGTVDLYVVVDDDQDEGGQVDDDNLLILFKQNTARSIGAGLDDVDFGGGSIVDLVSHSNC